MLLFIQLILITLVLFFGFNTSHVVIYLAKKRDLEDFQKFQYISCCYLSWKIKKEAYKALRFNTSHVVIYRVGDHSAYLLGASFNTSHVVIYRNSTAKTNDKKIVSIHLMLLFIAYKKLYRRLSGVVSIHLMLLFIRSTMLQFRLQFFVSIHLMLLFIINTSIILILRVKFQYISCCYLSN